ncbi:hypothetical protein CANCADRAFT_30708, partial [Tortispora caseinolytica NRRL Y-17796]
MSTDQFVITNIHCSSCETAIRKLLYAFPGVDHVDIGDDHSVKVSHDLSVTPKTLNKALSKAGYESSLTDAQRHYSPSWLRNRRHKQLCQSCKEGLTHADETVPTLKSMSSNTDKIYRVVFGISGMTCASCSNAITAAIKSVPTVIESGVDLIGKSATVLLSNKPTAQTVLNAIKDIGYDAEIVEILQTDAPKELTVSVPIAGMTCVSCVNNLTSAFAAQDIPAQISLVTNSGKFTVPSEDMVKRVLQIIEDCGYDPGEPTVTKSNEVAVKNKPRTVTLNIEGMFCDQCPKNVIRALQAFGDDIQFSDQHFSAHNPQIKISYIPHAPEFTIRQIMDSISTVSPQFTVTIVHLLSLDERVKILARKERKALMYRLILAVVCAIPAFIIGVVGMGLLRSSNPTRMYLMEPIWAGSVPRATWAMLFIATPAYFFAADVFHRKALREIYSLWRFKNKWRRRLFKFGSMDLLMSLGTTISYICSIATLILIARTPATSNMGIDTQYFDSVNFLTMFLLIGRQLEATAKAKTASAVSMLKKLRPKTALLVTEDGGDKEVLIDLIDVGDLIRVLPGMSPPADAVIVSGESEFDESTITGESLPSEKKRNDTVFAGTMNVGGQSVQAKITAAHGGTLLDSIVNAVQDGQMKRAPIERVADVLTGYFVPVVCLLALLTWFIWLGLAETGKLPQSYLDIDIGGWTVWSLQFCIAVFVIACPCGIGLAAPTALFVGSGLAAKHGIIARGGGEAFQEASNVDIIAFDKTGTLTEGGSPTVRNVLQIEPDSLVDGVQIARDLELMSTHPLGKAICNYADSQSFIETTKYEMTEEVSGKGMKGKAKGDQGSKEVIIGNEKILADHGIDIPSEWRAKIDAEKDEGCSVVFVARKEGDEYKLILMFAIADTLRKEAKHVVERLKEMGIEVWMITGDSKKTAISIGEQVGIPKERILAEVLPTEKADKVAYLQRAGKPNKRSIVAMVGDGINDAPSLRASDVGIAIGSGADVAVASAKFVLMQSNLTSVLTLIDISKVVFRRVKFNFGWAGVYNMIGIPIAAGVLYPYHNTRLSPEWAALAMALSSVSVILSSLALKLYRPKKANIMTTPEEVTNEK